MDYHFRIERTEKNYGRYNLTGNPFPISSVPEEHTRIIANQKRARENITKILSDVVFETGKPIHTLVTADYGDGKSHLLKVIRTTVLEDLYPQNLAVAGYVQLSGPNFHDLYKGFMKDLGIIFFEDFAQKLASKVKQELGLDSDVEKSEFKKQFVTYLYREIADLDLANALFSMFDSEESFRIAHRWICGEWLNVYTLRRYEIMNRIESDEKALSTFVAFRKLNMFVGIKMLFLCIDEVENIIYMSANDRGRVLESIRHLIDWNPEGINLIIGVSPEALLSISNYPPLDRIAAQINLDPLNEDNIHDYVRTYLTEKRIEVSKDTLFPFNEDINHKIYLILFSRPVRHNIRNYLKLCYYVIEIALQNNKEFIDDEVLEILESRDDIYLG